MEKKRDGRNWDAWNPFDEMPERRSKGGCGDGDDKVRDDINDFL